MLRRPRRRQIRLRHLLQLRPEMRQPHLEIQQFRRNLEQLLHPRKPYQLTVRLRPRELQHQRIPVNQRCQSQPGRLLRVELRLNRQKGHRQRQRPIPGRRLHQSPLTRNPNLQVKPASQDQLRRRQKDRVEELHNRGTKLRERGAK